MIFPNHPVISLSCWLEVKSVQWIHMEDLQEVCRGSARETRKEIYTKRIYGYIGSLTHPERILPNRHFERMLYQSGLWEFAVDGPRVHGPRPIGPGPGPWPEPDQAYMLHMHVQ